MIDATILRNEFSARFGGEGLAFFAPGRINLIGEHTDYNGGFVFPGAVDCGITAVIRPNGTPRVNLYAVDLKRECGFNIDCEQLPEDIHFRYIYGVVREMQVAGIPVGGFDAVYGGDVPLGAGMSSSAALECCFATALNDLFGNNRLDKMTLAKIGQATEHKYVGVMCGIMDQFASMHGREGALMRLDCRSGEYEYFPWNPQSYRLVLVNSCVKHELVGSPYNDRRNSCERVARLAGVKTLRDCTWQQLDALLGSPSKLEGVDREAGRGRVSISDDDYRRARYVLGETDRVLAVCDALQAGDYEEVGRQMYLTHEGLSKDYEVSCEEIDFLVDTARQCGVSGSRIMGGGFGGCTINLVKEELYHSFVERVTESYRERFGIECRIIPVVIGAGARRL